VTSLHTDADNEGGVFGEEELNLLHNLFIHSVPLMCQFPLSCLLTQITWGVYGVEESCHKVFFPCHPYTLKESTEASFSQ
jgi:hypothetical protein